MIAILALSTGAGDQVESSQIMGFVLLETDLYQSENNSY
jgi:hypothetical protein